MGTGMGHAGVGQVKDSLILITLLVELGVAAAVSASLARSNTFKDLLLMPRRSWRQTLALVAMITIPLTLGVWVRVRVPNFLAADLSYEATVLMGLLLGPGAAMLGGAALALPAVWHGEHWTLAVNLAVGAIAGTVGRFIEREEVWSFSPMIDLSLYRWVTRNLRKPQFDRQIMLLGLIATMQFATSMLGRAYPTRYFELHSPKWVVELAICACAPVVVGIPLKIWNAVRTERKLEEQSRLLMEARLDALQRQINPHFLFNTLNTITSLVRSQPELAREMIVKLANILRELLKDREAFVPFAEELAFTDDYLDIEVVRFGEKLRVVKEIAEETLAVMVPSMLLQPLIENSIKHGLEPRIDGGTVTLRSRMLTRRAAAAGGGGRRDRDGCGARGRAEPGGERGGRPGRGDWNAQRAGAHGGDVRQPRRGGDREPAGAGDQGDAGAAATGAGCGAVGAAGRGVAGAVGGRVAGDDAGVK